MLKSIRIANSLSKSIYQNGFSLKSILLFSPKSSPSSILKISSNDYSRKTKNILRGRYWSREKDGQYKDYNESITIIPEEFKDQDEYKVERRLNDEYLQRYKKHMKLKEKFYSLKLDDENSLKQQLTDVGEGGSCEYDLDIPKENVETSKSLESASSSSVGVGGESTDSDLPKKIGTDPYKSKMHQCIFCKYNIPLDYKNVQLLSQFVSSQTGIIYSQQVIGLCFYKYGELENAIQKARRLGLMPFFYKETVFLKDPELFNPTQNSLKEIPNNYDKRQLNSDDV